MVLCAQTSGLACTYPTRTLNLVLASVAGIYTLCVAREQYHTAERGGMGWRGRGRGWCSCTNITTCVSSQFQVYSGFFFNKQFEISSQSLEYIWGPSWGEPLIYVWGKYPCFTFCRKHRAGVDIHSCSQFLLELYSRWILPSSTARKTPVILISEVVRSVSLPSPLSPHPEACVMLCTHIHIHTCTKYTPQTHHTNTIIDALHIPYAQMHTYHTCMCHAFARYTERHIHMQT